MPVDLRDATVTYVQAHGPVLPAQIAKHLSSNTLLASAVLSELVSKGRLKISKLKVGGSPLYFLPGQEEQLLRFIESLDEKDRRTLALLKERRILRDSEQEPLTRVSLRQIKDFAVPLTVTLGDSTETFWKYFAVAETEVHGLIERCLNPVVVSVPPAAGKVAVDGVAKRPKVVRKRKPVAKPVERPLTQVAEPPAVVAPPARDVVRDKSSVASSAQPLVSAAPAVVETEPDDALLSVLSAYCASVSVVVSEHSVVKRNSELDCILGVPSAVGVVSFYGKILGKQKVVDSDVTGAFAEGQLRKLPVLLFARGELSAKAAEVAGRLGVTFVRLPG